MDYDTLSPAASVRLSPKSQLSIPRPSQEPPVAAAKQLPPQTLPKTPEHYSTPKELHESPHPVHRRCGVKGDGRLMTDGLNMVQCSICQKYSHFACQQNGRANKLPPRTDFICDSCSGRDVLPLYMSSDPRCVSSSCFACCKLMYLVYTLLENAKSRAIPVRG